MAIFYITVGALLDVWTLVWYMYLRNTNYQGAAYYWCAGLCLTGLTLIVIGFGLGHIGRAARNAELPPTEVTGASARAEQIAAAQQPVMAAPPVATAVPMNPGVPTTAAAPVAQAPSVR